MEVRRRAGTLCMSQYEREQFLITSELENMGLAEQQQNGDILDQMPQILQNEMKQQSKELIDQQKLNLRASDSSQQLNQN